VTGKAVMLDEIINYVQSLQRQVEVCRFLILNEVLFVFASCNQFFCSFLFCLNSFYRWNLQLWTHKWTLTLKVFLQKM